uniref:Shugoshin_C domain-containing protein n=1 Tax=Loa loa TaxID=7209 RepID=A0A1I7VRK5_LOALO
MCTVCRRSPFVYENVGHRMSEKTKKYFQTPNTLLMNALRKVNSVIKFQQNQYNIMRRNVSSMHEQMNNVADRCKETAKICDFLERNAKTLATNMQHQHEILQNLNSSFADCSLTLKHFGDVSDNVDTSGSVVSQHNSSLQNNQTLSNFNATINKPFKLCSDVDEDLSMSCLQSVKASGNLAAVFGGKDRNSAKKLRQSISSINPYMKYISQKNTHSLGVIDNNFTCSAATQIKKDEFNLQQLGSKRRPKTSENIQLSQDIFKMASSTDGLFNIRAHSLSRSPPRKNSRSGDN